jgi:hypothetical protein
MGETRSVYRILVGEHHGKVPLEGCRDNIKAGSLKT